MFELSVRYMLLSALGFAITGVFVKLASARGIPVLEIVAARALVSAVISYFDIKRKGISLWGRRRGLLFARGLVGSFALVCVFYALAVIPFAEATVLQYLHPMFTAVLAIVFLEERVQWPTALCVVLSFVGLLVIVQPDVVFGQQSIDYPPLAIAAAVAGAFGSGVAYVLVRKLNATEDPSVIIFYFPLVAFPVSLLLLGDGLVLPQGVDWLLLLMVGIATQVGQIGLTKAMQTETASRATSFSYSQVLFAVVLGWWFFNEVPSFWTWLGGGLIIAGALINLCWRPAIGRG